AYAEDLAGNNSLTNTIRIMSMNTFKLHLDSGSARLSRSRGFSMGIDILPGLKGRIEFSTNLMNWLPLVNFVGSNSMFYFEDVAATNSPRRFYRAVVP